MRYDTLSCDFLIFNITIYQLLNLSHISVPQETRCCSGRLYMKRTDFVSLQTPESHTKTALILIKAKAAIIYILADQQQAAFEPSHRPLRPFSSVESVPEQLLCRHALADIAEYYF